MTTTGLVEAGFKLTRRLGVEPPPQPSKPTILVKIYTQLIKKPCSIPTTSPFDNSSTGKSNPTLQTWTEFFRWMNSYKFENLLLAQDHASWRRKIIPCQLEEKIHAWYCCLLKTMPVGGGILMQDIVACSRPCQLEEKIHAWYCCLLQDHASWRRKFMHDIVACSRPCQLEEKFMHDIVACSRPCQLEEKIHAWYWSGRRMWTTCYVYRIKATI